MAPPQGDQKPKTENNPNPAPPASSPAAAGAASDKPAQAAEPSENSLEDTSESSANSKASTEASKPDAAAPQADTAKSGGGNPIKKLLKKFDIYFLIFVFLMIISLIVAYAAVQKNKTAKTVGIASQTLNQSALSQINNNDTQVGGTNQTLDVQSDTVFGGNVLVKDSLQVAGSLKVAGTLSLPGITVSGTTDLGQVNASTLTLTGAETVKGQLTVDQGMTVNGVASFSGPLNAAAITVTSLEVNGDFTFEHHVYSTGSIPKSSSTSALGAGGTSTINGTDTAGEVNINTGIDPDAGCLVDVTYAQSYAIVPFIVITPVGQNSGDPNLGVYVTKSYTGFSVCATAPQPDTPMSFDYFIIG